jgi:acyl-CoA thioesterase II
MCVGSFVSDADSLRQKRFDGPLAEVLQVSPVGPDLYKADSSTSAFDRLYGGQLLAQSLLAAAGTVEPDRSVHSLHSYFVRLGAPTTPVSYAVERLGDTRSISTRLVRSSQPDGPLTTTLLSFQKLAAVGSHQADPLPDVKPPESFISRDEQLIAHYRGSPPRNAGLGWPMEIRYIDRRPWDATPSDGRNRMWMRMLQPVSDVGLTMFEPIVARQGLSWEQVISGETMFGATLDHSFWLHTEFAFNDWVLHIQDATVMTNGRGLTTGRFYARDGGLVASVAQEIVVKAARSGEAARRRVHTGRRKQDHESHCS